jgi:hypothetical protein
MGKEHTKLIREVKAEDLARELTQDTGKLLSRLRTGKLSFPLHNAKVVGKLNLKHLTIEKPVEIWDCEFEGDVDLRYCEFKQVVDFSGCTFHKEFNSGDDVGSHTIFRKDLVCNETDSRRTVFRGPARFQGIQVEGSAYFLVAQFLGKEQAADFTNASFGKNFECRNSTFDGKVNCHSITCSTLDCREATFRESVDFRRLQCNAVANFRDATFEKDLDLRFASIDGDLHLGGAYFAERVKLGHTRITQRLRLDGSYFKKEVELYDLAVKVLQLMDPIYVDEDYPVKVRRTPEDQDRPKIITGPQDLDRIPNMEKAEFEDLAKRLFPFKERRSLNLGDIVFERFHGGPKEGLANELALKFVKEQMPAEFSRDPYLQLEKYYRSVGDENQAKTTYYLGRIALRANAKDKRHGRARWSFRKCVSDDFFRVLTGYGTKVGRILVIAFIFLILGTLVFYLPTEALNGVNASANANPSEEGLLFRTLYSLDLFLPIVNLRVDEQWVPNGPLLQAYATIHTIVGWLIVPLLLAALAGIIRR